MDEENNLRILAPAARINSIAIRPVILIEKNAILDLPLSYTGGDLGLGNGGEPWIHFKDACGKTFLTHSVEWLLKNIDSFAEGRDREQALADAAVHYGLDVYALLSRA